MVKLLGILKFVRIRFLLQDVDKTIRLHSVYIGTLGVVNDQIEIETVSVECYERP